MRLRIGSWLVVVSFGFIAGCGSGGAGTSVTETAEVSGKVLFNGEPLPGGRLTFVNVNNFAASANIDENGRYSIKAPLGDVKIGVDNAMLRNQGAGRAQMLKRPDAPATTLTKGTYVPIPNKYHSPATSGLKFTVQPGAQTHDISFNER